MPQFVLQKFQKEYDGPKVAKLFLKKINEKPSNEH